MSFFRKGGKKSKKVTFDYNEHNDQGANTSIQSSKTKDAFSDYRNLADDPGNLARLESESDTDLNWNDDLNQNKSRKHVDQFDQLDENRFQAEDETHNDDNRTTLKEKKKKKGKAETLVELKPNSENNQENLTNLKYDSNMLCEWGTHSVAKVMSNHPTQEALTNDLEGQNLANAVVWENTMFGKVEAGDMDNISPSVFKHQERVMREQQEFLKRNFLAMASLGIQGGNQDTTIYNPIEQFTNSKGARVNLATIASGGGRINYRSYDGTGQMFDQFLWTGDEVTKRVAPIKRKHGQPTPDDYKANFKKQDQSGLPTSYMGAYYRTSTHVEKLEYGITIKEVLLSGPEAYKHQLKDDVTEAIGFNIATGGVGVRLNTIEGKNVQTGFQGRATDSAGKVYQTGAGLYRFKEDGHLGSLMIAFEGSSPELDNIHGGSHGALSTTWKSVSGQKSSYTLTGQGKRKTWGLTLRDAEEKTTTTAVLTKEGGIIADVNSDELDKLRARWSMVKGLNEEDQQDFYRRLLLTETNSQREKLFSKYKSRANDAKTGGFKRSKKKVRDQKVASSSFSSGVQVPEQLPDQLPEEFKSTNYTTTND